MGVELLVGEVAKSSALPVRFHKQRVGAGQRREPAFKSLEFLFPGQVVPQSVPRNGLDHRQAVADAVRQFAQQQTLASLAGEHRRFRLMPLGYIDKGDNDAVDLVLAGAIRPQPHVVPAAVAAANFAPQRYEVGQYRAHIFDQIIVLQPMDEIGDQAPFVTLRDAEKVGDPLGKALDAQR